MAYRDPDEDNLEAARAMHLEAARASLRSVVERRAELDAIEAEIRDEIAACERAARKLPLLPRVEIASPCDARWEDMSGTDQIRRCEQCHKNVHDVSAMDQEEALRFLSEVSRLAPCVRLFVRPDGRFLTADCPVGIERRRRRRALPAVALAALACMVQFGALTVALSVLVREARGALEEPAPLPEPFPMNNAVPPPPPVYRPAPPPAGPRGLPPGLPQRVPEEPAFIHVHGADGNDIYIDGVRVSGGVLTVAPGAHSIVIHRARSRSLPTTVVVPSGAHHHITVKPVAALTRKEREAAELDAAVREALGGGLSVPSESTF
ncbi:MAG: hypothetical protein KC657_13260 [Myxococcales bacterium]|nr:hypothetical protein [Myxococcales bacterium]